MLRESIHTTISRDEGYAMRGMAILAIMLHNFCHSIQGVTPENEFGFLYANLNSLTSPKDTLIEWLFDVLSFFGWYGVPVFMFLTGYGLVMKYERDHVPLYIGRFLKRNFLKLFFLMMPGVIALIILSLSRSLPHGHVGAYWIMDYLFQLTMLPDIIFPLRGPNPGVFWYFGLTMEFYIIYALLIHRKPRWWMWATVAISLILQFVTDPSSSAMEWIRHNATGWALVLVMGILYGRSSHIGRRVAYATVIMSVLLVLPSMLNPMTWQISILTCVVIAIVIAKWSMKLSGWRNLWIWVGQLSPMLFVAHPVARSIAMLIFEPVSPSIIPLVAYLCLAFLLALVFRPFTNACYRRYLRGRST